MGFVIYTLIVDRRKAIIEIHVLEWMKKILIGISILAYILYYYNKRMVGIFNFEQRFDQYLKESDMQLYELHQIRQMKAIDPTQYYKIVSDYYHSQYPTLDFSIMFSDDIQEYPVNNIMRIFYILILFIKQTLRIYQGRDLSNLEGDTVPSLRVNVPVVTVLTFYEWIHNDFYCTLLLYFFIKQ